MKPRANARPHGELRQSQVVTTFGPGAMLDLPGHSILVGGLEMWGDPVQQGFTPVREERLLDRVRKALDRPDAAMYAPPTQAEDGQEPRGITGWLFPEWFVSQHEETSREGVRSRRLVHRRDLVKGKYFAPDKQSHRVVPIRFVQACVNGHIDDVDWHGFAHEFQSDCKRKLWLDERGTSGDLTDILVRCECGRPARSLAQALPYGDASAPLGFCRGRRPWLGAHSAEKCGGEEGKTQPNRLLVRSASNAYFPQVLSVIHIPESDARLREAVEKVWEDFLLYVEDAADLKKERRKAKVAPALEGFGDDEVLAEIQRRKAGAAPAEKSLKQAEIETLLGQKESIGEDVPEGDFYATALPLPARAGAMAKVQRIVLVHRLREVTAQIGFTRFEAPLTDVNGELSLDVRRASLAREASWVPAIENRGEGVLAAFDTAILDAWAARPAVQQRVRALREGFDAWSAAHPKAKMLFPGPRYIMLHSLSHLLITAASLACGYWASSIRERIYVTSASSGILLYTGTPDAEGTLGGLVEIGRNLGEHLRAALELGRLCSNDPVCCQHRPDDRHEERFLHGAACHGCLLIAEPSCERRNEYLDRALVVPTVEALGAELFGEGDLGMSPFRRLTPEARRALMLALDAGRLSPPYTPLALQRYVGAHLAEAIAAELDRLGGLGMTPVHARELLAALEGDERGHETTLVWSGPEEGSTGSRDTSVVVRELFAGARRSVLVAGFAVYQGPRVFKVLAERMDADPALAVTMFLNVERPRHDTSSAAELLKGFAERFREQQWPGKRVPAVYYDPRAIEPAERGKKRSSLHAKCVLVDDQRALVTSANFTEAAQERNIEVGVLVESPSFTAALRSQFEGLVAAGRLVRVPGL